MKFTCYMLNKNTKNPFPTEDLYCINSFNFDIMRTFAKQLLSLTKRDILLKSCSLGDFFEL